MNLVAGIDIGNASTEIVIGRTGGLAFPLGARRRPTIGMKGARSSLLGAAVLLADLEQELGVRADTVAIADIVPAVHFTARWTKPRPDATAPARLLDRTDSPTCAGSGLATGTVAPIALLAGSDQLPAGPTIVTVDEDWGFVEAAEVINGLLTRGAEVNAVLVAADEAVLIANRLERSVLVVDAVPTRQTKHGQWAVVEVAKDAGFLKTVTDPVALTRLLHVSPAQHHLFLPLAASLASSNAAVIIEDDAASRENLPDQGWITNRSGERMTLTSSPEEIACWLRPGDVERIEGPKGSDLERALQRCSDEIQDFYAVTVSDTGSVPVALLGAHAPTSVANDLSKLVGRPVEVVAVEADAALFGARSTPGAPEPVAVCDVGAGTIDIATEGKCLTAAGAGALISEAIAADLDVTRALAELIKRVPSVRIEQPHVVSLEDGRRMFSEKPAAGDAVGRLCVRSHGGEWLPFSDNLTPGQWRSRRQQLKRQVLGGSVQRALHSLELQPDAVLLCGGGALDDEIVALVGERLRHITVGRADTAGCFGARFAVAWGLVVLTADESFRPALASVESAADNHSCHESKQN